MQGFGLGEPLDVWTLRLSDGTVVRGTPSHPVWSHTAGDWLPLGLLQPGDRVDGEQSISRERSMNSSDNSNNLSPADRTTVTSDEFRRVCELLCQHLSSRSDPVVTLCNSYYWTFLPPAKYDLESHPGDPMVGDLRHDVERLQQVLDGDRPEDVIQATFRWFGELCIALSAENPEARSARQ